MRSMVMPRRNHQTESLERLNRELGEAKGTPLSERILVGRPRSLNKRAKAVSKSFTGRFKSFTEEEIARGMICDGQRVTVFFVAQQELTFVVGAPQLVGLLPQRQGRALSMIASAPSALDQAVAVEHGVDGAARRNLHLTGKATQQALADLARAPVGFFPFEIQNGGLHLLRQLVGVTPGPAGTVSQSFQTVFLVAV